MKNDKPRQKHFITFISLQEDALQNLALANYQAVDNGWLNYSQEHAVRFPIVPVIAGYVEEGDDIVLTSILAEATGVDEDVLIHYKRLQEEVEAIKENDTVEFSCTFEKIHTHYEATDESLTKLWNDIFSCIKEDDDVYACITYGEKPYTIALYLSFVEALTRYKDSIEIGCCVYGQYKKITEQNIISRIKDITPLIFREGYEYPFLPKIERPTGAGTDDKPEKCFVAIVPLNNNPPPKFPLNGDKEVFPIIPVMAENIEDGDTVRIVLIRFEEDPEYQGITDIMDNNIDDFKAAVKRILRDRQVRLIPPEPIEITTPFNSTSRTLSELCNRIINEIPKGDLVYADVTFGEKVDTIALHQALTEIALNEIGETEIVKCIYGHVYHREENKPGKIKDLTNFIHRGAFDLRLRRMDVDNPDEIIDYLLNGGEEDDE
jgi:hypothetical protein